MPGPPVTIRSTNDDLIPPPDEAPRNAFPAVLPGRSPDSRLLAQSRRRRETFRRDLSHPRARRKTPAVAELLDQQHVLHTPPASGPPAFARGHQTCPASCAGCHFHPGFEPDSYRERHGDVFRFSPSGTHDLAAGHFDQKTRSRETPGPRMGRTRTRETAHWFFQGSTLD